MLYIKINETLYPAVIDGNREDREWNKRDRKSITLEMDCATAASLFVDGAAWSIVRQDEVPVYQTDENGEYVLDENGHPIQTGTEVQEIEWDNSDYYVAGAITDHRDGTVTVKMGKKTDGEMLAELMEVLDE